MTLIIGISLCDCAYLASDTRLSFFKKGEVEPYQTKDNVLKLITLKDNILVSSAGTAKFAKFYIKKLMKEKSFTNIAVLKDKIIEWTKDVVNDYLQNNDFPVNCILFGGVDKSRHKVISGDKLIELSKAYQEITTSGMALKPALWEAIKSPDNQGIPFPTLATFDSCIFALIIDPKNGVLKVETAEWGEYLAYGPNGITKNDIPKRIFGDLELSATAGNPFHDSTVLTGLINQVAEEKNLLTVGGSIVTHYVDQEDAVKLVTGTVHRRNKDTGVEDIISSTEAYGKDIYTKTLRGQLIKLIPIHEYSLPEDQKLSLQF